MFTYEDAIKYIHGTYTFGIKLGLDNITKLLEYMGNPQEELKFVHIAGTNGKGSTSNMISSIMKNSGYKVGLYISPYLEEFTERIQINGEQITKERLGDATFKVKKCIDKMMEDGYPQPSEFEVVTAIGFQYFHEEKVDIIVLEVGMGGRLDATNVIKESEVTIITTIGLDHIQYLGDTIEAIAYEKAGTIKYGGQVVITPQASEITSEILKVCEEMKAIAYIPNIDRISQLEASLQGQRIHYSSNTLGDFDFNLSLLGKHQISNCLTALGALEVLKDKYTKINIESIQQGMSVVKFPGRFEVLSNYPTIIIDGAHNEAGIDALVDTVQTYLNRKVKLILGILEDKDFTSMIKKISIISDEIYTVRPNNDRGMSSKALAETISNTCPSLKVTPLSSIEKAAKIAKSGSPEDVYLFAGSLYMIGEARSKLTTILDANS